MLEAKSTILTKMTATENDFLLLTEEGALTLGDPDNFSELSRLICHRLRGVGADGLLILSPTDVPSAWKWIFYNSDGSKAEMCGNAARCAGLWAKRRSPEVLQFTFLTPSGPVGAEPLSNSSVCVTMPPVKWNQGTDLTYGGLDFTWIDSGVPHAVAPLQNSPRPLDLKDIAQRVRNHSKWGPSGANVTFIYSKTPGDVEALTFERGVEAFTRSCGTGAVAAATYHAQMNPMINRIQVRVPGGLLEVQLGNSQPRLLGPAQFVAKIQLDPSFIQSLRATQMGDLHR